MDSLTVDRDRVQFLIQPGYVRSVTDGDVHWVSAPKLVALYGLRHGEWRVYDTFIDRGTLLPILRPRYDGQYVNQHKGAAS